MFATCIHATPARLFTFLNVKFIVDQVAAKLPQNTTELVGIPKTFEKIDEFSEKKNLIFFFKNPKGCRFAVECVSNSKIS